MILAMADPWREGRWAAVHGRSVERFEMRPSTYFLKTPEAVARLLRDAAPDERSNPLRRPTRPNGSPDRERLHVGVVRTGRLRDSIRAEVTEIAGDVLRAEVGTDVPYAAAVEMGTRTTAAHPFLFPALEACRDEVQRLIADAVRRALNAAQIA